LTALLATVSYCSDLSKVSSHSHKHDEIVEALVSLDEDLPSPSEGHQYAKCDALVMVKNAKVVQNNLGGAGPDTGAEGMTFAAEVFMKDEEGNAITGKNVTVEVHAVSEYDFHDEHSKIFNGLHGKFLAILIQPDSALTFNITVYDEFHEKIVLPYFVLTFFDIDREDEGLGEEYIEAANYKHFYIADKSDAADIAVTEGAVTQFKAATSGIAGDNPHETEALEIFQKKKALMLQYESRSSVEVTIGSTQGNHTRGFLFTLRPSLMCAKTHLKNATHDEWVDAGATHIEGIEWPWMDGAKQTPFMEIPTFKVGPGGTLPNVTDESDNSGANGHLGSKVLLITVTLLGVMWPFSNLQ